MGKGRLIQPHEFTQIVRERTPDYFDDDDEFDLDGQEQSQHLRTLDRCPLTDEEKDTVTAWMIQRIRSIARIPEGSPPTEWEMYRAAIMMMCLIIVLDNPPRPEDDGAAYFDLTELAVALDIIFITPCKGNAYVRKIAHELAHRLMIQEVAQEVFFASEVRIEAPGWDNARERHKLAVRVENGLMVETTESVS